MKLNFRNPFRKKASERMTTRTAEQIALLATLRRDVLPDPVAKRTELRALSEQITANEAEFQRLQRDGGPDAFLRLQPVAERLRELRARAAKLPAEIANTERREQAYLELAEQFDVVADDVQAQLDDLIDHPPAAADERRRAIERLDEATRLHFRMACHLAAVSTDRRFKEPPDALRLLRQTWAERAQEVDGLRLPGMKRKFAAPPAIAALLENMEGRTPRKEIA